MSLKKFLKFGACLLPTVIVAAVSAGGLLTHVPDYQAIQKDILGSFADVSLEKEEEQAGVASAADDESTPETAEVSAETDASSASSEQAVSSVSSLEPNTSARPRSKTDGDNDRSKVSSVSRSSAVSSVSEIRTAQTSRPAEQSREVSAVSRPAETSREVSVVSRPTDQSREVSAVSRPTDQSREVPAVSRPAETSRQVSVVSRPAEQSHEVSKVSRPTEESHQVSAVSEPTEEHSIVTVSESSVEEEPVSEAPKGRYRDGTYTASADIADDSPQEWFIYTLQVTVKVIDGAIASVNSSITWDADGDQSDNGHYVLAANRSLSGKIVEQQGTEGVDIVSGATYSSRGILSAVDEALRQAEP